MTRMERNYRQNVSLNMASFSIVGALGLGRGAVFETDQGFGNPGAETIGAFGGLIQFFAGEFEFTFTTIGRYDIELVFGTFKTSGQVP